MIERLLDHQQSEVIERPQVMLVCNGIGGVGVHRKQNIRIMPPHLAHDVNIPTGFDLELDPLITDGQVLIDALQEAIASELNAEADAHGYTPAYSSDRKSTRLNS